MRRTTWLLMALAALGSAPLAAAQGELVLVGAYEPYVGPADVGVAIELPFPRVLGGQEPYTFELTDGALPPPFVTRAVESPEHAGGTFALELGADGALRGSTGWPGRYAGTVTVTDANGRTGHAEFVLDLALALEYVGELELHVPADPAVVVNGDRVRVSGVPVPALPETGMVLRFELSFDASVSRGAVGRPAEAGDFDIHHAHGTVSKMRPTPPAAALRWVYRVVARLAERVDGALVPVEGGPVSAPVTLTFVRP